MTLPGVPWHSLFGKLLVAIAVTAAMAACVPDRIKTSKDGPFAPGVDPKGEAVSGVEVGHRLIAAGQYELALDAFTRAALDEGLTAEILNGFGTANLGLGRLGQAEDLLIRATKEDEKWSGPWNNLGVVMMEQGRTREAEQIFRKAYALDNGESDAIRDNLRLALAKSENPDNTSVQNEPYKLVQRGEGDFKLRVNQ